MKVYADDDPTKVVGHEPPYTEDEELELYRRMSLQPGATIYRGPAPPQPSPKLPPEREEK